MGPLSVYFFWPARFPVATPQHCGYRKGAVNMLPMSTCPLIGNALMTFDLLLFLGFFASMTRFDQNFQVKSFELFCISLINTLING